MNLTETLVLEFNCHEPIGTDEKGHQKIVEYVNMQSRLLGKHLVAKPATHLSVKYGLSGWAPLEDTAIHIYAWDHYDQPHSPFVSVDIALMEKLSQEKLDQLINSTLIHFKAIEGQCTFKSSSNPHPKDWTDLAPHIVRQRLSISGIIEENIEDLQMSSYLKDLAPELDMLRLSEPIVNNEKAWVHWETSGTIASWNNQSKKVYVDIYTCKSFSSEKALEFTRKRLKLTNVTFKNY